MGRRDLADLTAFVAVADRLSFRARGGASWRHAIGAPPFDAAAGRASRRALTLTVRPDSSRAVIVGKKRGRVPQYLPSWPSPG